MDYEQMIIEAYEKGIEVYEIDFKGNGKGYYSDNIIGISKNIDTNSEKKCVLIEEIGHMETSLGNILDQSKIENRQQERRARAWGYERLVGIVDLINAYKNGIRNRFELAEYLDVTEKYIDQALNYYKEKYGLYYEIDNYLIYFEPLIVLEKF